MHGDGAVLSKLLFGFMNLANKINEALPGFWYALLRPVGELELPDGPRLAVLHGETIHSL